MLVIIFTAAGQNTISSVVIETLCKKATRCVRTPYSHIQNNQIQINIQPCILNMTYILKLDLYAINHECTGKQIKIQNTKYNEKA